MENKKSQYVGPQEPCNTFRVPTNRASGTIVLDPDPEEEIRMLCIVNCRNKLNSLLPQGYYGNAIVFPAAITTARKLSTNPRAYALDLIKKAKACATEEYVKSVLDLLVARGRPHFTVSDLVKVRPGDIYFGWGKPIYSGPAVGGIGAIPGTLSFYIPYKNGKGEEGMVVPMCLPAATMDRFEDKLNAALGGDKKNDLADKYKYVVSRLQYLACFREKAKRITVPVQVR